MKQPDIVIACNWDGDDLVARTGAIVATVASYPDLDNPSGKPLWRVAIRDEGGMENDLVDGMLTREQAVEAVQLRYDHTALMRRVADAATRRYGTYVYPVIGCAGLPYRSFGEEAYMAHVDAVFCDESEQITGKQILETLANKYSQYLQSIEPWCWHDGEADMATKIRALHFIVDYHFRSQRAAR